MRVAQKEPLHLKKKPKPRQNSRNKGTLLIKGLLRNDLDPQNLPTLGFPNII